MYKPFTHLIGQAHHWLSLVFTSDFLSGKPFLGNAVKLLLNYPVKSVSELIWGGKGPAVSESQFILYLTLSLPSLGFLRDGKSSLKNSPYVTDWSNTHLTDPNIPLWMLNLVTTERVGWGAFTWTCFSENIIIPLRPFTVNCVLLFNWKSKPRPACQ